MAKKQAVALPPDGAWDHLVGVAACLAVAVFPFLPDEKLNRLKLLSLQLGVLALAAVVGARILASGRWPISFRRFSDASTSAGDSPMPPLAVAFWLSVNAVLAIGATDGALAAAEMGRVLLAGTAFFAFFFAGLTPRWTFRLLVTWTVSALLLSLYASLQRRGGLGPLLVPKMGRAIGTFGNPILLSAYLTLSVFVATALMRKAATETGRYFGLTAAVLIVAAIAATGTRSAYLGLAAAAAMSVVIAGPQDRAKIALSALLAIALAVALSFPLWHRDQAHLLIWRDTLRLIAQHPFGGVGLGAFHVYFPSVAQPDLIAKWPKGAFVVNFAHNEYLQALAEGGPVLLGSFLAVLVTFLLVVRTRAEAPETPRSIVPLALGVVAVAAQNVASVDMRFSVSLTSVFMVMGVALSDAERRARWAPSLLSRAPAWGRGVLAVAWMLGLALVADRLVIGPFVSERQVATAPDFFDERLLEPAKTISDLEALGRTYPREPLVIERLAYAYAKEMKTQSGVLNPVMTENAIAAYRRVIDLDSQRVSAHNNLGNILYTAGRADEAIAEWKKAAELDPTFIDPRLNLGKVLYVRGDLKQAADWFQSVLKIQPGHPEATLFLRRMTE